MLNELKKIKMYLLTGVSYTIPLIASGGILIALAIALVPMGSTGPDFSNSPNIKMIFDIGAAAFGLFPPILAAYIAYAMVNKPGLAAGLVGGFIADKIGAGFLGAMIAGLLAGFIIRLLLKIKYPQSIRPILPILILPIISTTLVGIIMFSVVGSPIAGLMESLRVWLTSMEQGNAILLAMALGAMVSFDMGGPINKTAFFFAAALIKEGNFLIMGQVATAICIPPLGLALATFIGKKLWSEEQKKAGMASFAMGLIGITEGAIPFAAADPFRVIPSIMLGSIAGTTMAMFLAVGNHAPHGGPVVIPVIDNKMAYLISILFGVVVTALTINLIKYFGNKKEIA